MNKIVFYTSTVLLSIFINTGYSQNKIPNNSIGISIPIVWNNSQAVFYDLGKKQMPKGSAASYGINVDYSRSVSNNLFLTVGFGYFKQDFNIFRPFDFGDTLTRLLYHTKSYKYDNFHFAGGLGYIKNVSKTLSLKGAITYNIYYSFKQIYI